MSKSSVDDFDQHIIQYLRHMVQRFVGMAIGGLIVDGELRIDVHCPRYSKNPRYLSIFSVFVFDDVSSLLI